jgi:hypothetical protein
MRRHVVILSLYCLEFRSTTNINVNYTSHSSMRAAIAIALAVTAAFCLNRFAEDSWWASDGRLHYEADEASPIANRSTTSVADASSVDDKARRSSAPTLT